MKFPIPLDILDSFSIDFFESKAIPFYRKEITRSMIRYYLWSYDWGDLEYFQLSMVDEKTTEFFIPFPQMLYFIDGKFVKSWITDPYHPDFEKEIRFTDYLLRKYFQLPAVDLTGESDDRTKKPIKNAEEKSITGSSYSFDIHMMRTVTVYEIYEKYTSLLSTKFNLDKEYFIPFSDDSDPNKKTSTRKANKPRRGGPIPTPEEEKKRILDDYERKKGKIIQQLFCDMWGIGVSTLGKWRREARNRAHY